MKTKSNPPTDVGCKNSSRLADELLNRAIPGLPARCKSETVLPFWNVGRRAVDRVREDIIVFVFFLKERLLLAIDVQST